MDVVCCSSLWLCLPKNALLHLQDNSTDLDRIYLNNVKDIGCNLKNPAFLFCLKDHKYAV